MIHYKAAFETTNCLRPCMHAYLHKISLRRDREFTTPALLCFLFDRFVYVILKNQKHFFSQSQICAVEYFLV
jgi:hypothetical protein